MRDERESSELRELFIAILGHDLKNPLRAIFATSELMLKKAHNPVIASMAARIKPNSRRMSSLIDDVLDFAPGCLAGGLGLQIAETESINAGFTAVVKELQHGQPTRQIDYEFDVESRSGAAKVPPIARAWDSGFISARKFFVPTADSGRWNPRQNPERLLRLAPPTIGALVTAVATNQGKHPYRSEPAASSYSERSDDEEN